MAFSKELPALFEVKIPVDQYTNTNDGLFKNYQALEVKNFSGELAMLNLTKLNLFPLIQQSLLERKNFYQLNLIVKR